jgi:hypothetical protein
MTRLTEGQRVLLREKINSLTAEHHCKIDRITKDFNKERARLEEMLKLDFVPQRLPK